MEKVFEKQTKHKGQILDLDMSETCIFTTGADSSLRVFDIDNGMLVVAPMEQMECSHIARQDEFIVIRCGEG